jgi:CBS-domain-containing membrane protein
MLQSDLSTLITFNPQTIHVSTTLADLLAQWTEPEFHEWPVVDDDMRLVGVVSEQEVISAVAARARSHPNQGLLGTDDLREETTAQFMSSPATTISRWDSQSNGLYLLLRNRLHCLPVIDEERLIGQVTTTDYLREFSYGDWPVCRQPVCEWVKDGIDPLDCDASPEEAATAMAQAGVDFIGVVNGNLPLGVISARDVQLAQCRLDSRRLLREELAFSGPTSIRELAAKSPVVRPGARLSEAADLMVQHARQAIAVVTQSGRMIGVISEETLLAALAGHKPALSCS